MHLFDTLLDQAVDAPFEALTLFESPDLLVRKVSRGQGPICYVTFDSYTDNRSLDRSGFGEDFLQARGIDAIHVISRDNYWYQHSELPEALAAIAAEARGYDRVFAYGSSMGGFAALHYGADCGATVGIAISPQYSVDPEVAPFEDRWSFDASRIAYRNDRTTPLASQYILYDPQDSRDRAHFELFAARSETIGVRVPYAGHPAGSYLHETDMFSALFAGIHGCSLDVLGYERELRARRRQSGQYFFALSRRTPSHRPRTRIALARMAVETGPGYALYVSNLAIAQDAAGDFSASAETHARALALAPDNLHVLHNHVQHLEQIGDLEGAQREAESLVETHPEVFIFRLTRRRLWRTGRQQRWYGGLTRLLKLDDFINRVRERLVDGMFTARDIQRRFTSGDSDASSA